MKANIIFLAAGKGTRLRPHTENVPKGMVPLLNKALIERNMDEWKKIGDSSFCFVTGYKAEVLERLGAECVHNADYDQTNMVWSLACALDYIRSLSGRHVFVSYADIIVHRSQLEKLLDASGSFCVEVDLHWRDLWLMRMENYLDDVETLIHDGEKIISLGQKPKNDSEVQGQYIGLMRFDRKLLIDLLLDYVAWVKEAQDDAETHRRKNIYMTDFIQNHINSNGVVKPVFIDGGWLEVDTVEDLKIYESNKDAAIFQDLLWE